MPACPSSSSPAVPPLTGALVSQLRRTARATALALALPALLVAAGCTSGTVTDAEPGPTIEVGSASPQTTPVPTGDATAPDLPQIEFVGAPSIVSPGQVVTVRLGSNFMPSTDVTGVAVEVEGVDGWFKANASPQAAAGSDGVSWIFPVTVIVADTAPPGEQVRMDFALLATGDEAGGYKSWQPLIDVTGAVTCPQDSDCSIAACGPDPVCGLACGTCESGQACNGDGQCEALASSCGDGMIADGETCDGTDVGAETCVTQGFDAGTLTCNATCDGLDTSACTYTCGDDGIDPGETCDGADLGSETCETQGFDGGPLACNATCDGLDTSACTYTCGDGSLDPGEDCDDGGTDAGDGCDATCAVEPGWACTGEPSTCAETCGDGVLDPGEDCDDGGTDAGDGCDATCAVEPGWACTGEPSTCAETCGNGTVDAGEDCEGSDLNGADCASQGFDDGVLACDGACAFDTSACTYICGDGNIDPGEDCDDGGTDPGDGCDAACAVEPGWACTGEPSACVETCGDGVIGADEDCEGSDLNGADCISEGFEGGTLACGGTCTFDTAACFACGDGVLNGSEACDGDDFGFLDCIGVGFDAGTPTCSADCTTIDHSACTFTCGDDGIDPGETCDGTDVGIETCMSQGFDAGTLVCNGACDDFDTSGCGTCGNSVVEGGEFCDVGPTGTCGVCVASDAVTTRGYSFVGEAAGDRSGNSVASVGDVDGDGKDDVLIGASGAGPAAEGKAYLMLSSALTFQPAGATIGLSNASYSFVGEAAGDTAGHRVSSAGDVDGDGRADLLIGAYANDEGGADAGKTYLMLASDITAQPPGTSFDLASASYSFVGEAAGDQSALGLSGAGDVDGDGRDDVLIGARHHNAGAADEGKTYLMLASDITAQAAGTTFDLSNASYSFSGSQSGELSGGSVAIAGDVDGDGRDDVLIGGYQWSGNGAYQQGRAYLILSSAITAQPLGHMFDLNSDSSANFRGAAASDYLGVRVEGAGDVDGDGKADLLIGAYANDAGGTNAGATYLMRASTINASSTGTTFHMGVSASYSFLGEAANDYSGASVAGAGDVDADGLDDLLIGAYGWDVDPANDSQEGKAYLVPGSDILTQGNGTAFNLADVPYAFLGEAAGDRAHAVASAGDVDGDGKADLLISAYENDAAGVDAGKTYLILSPF